MLHATPRVRPLATASASPEPLRPTAARTANCHDTATISAGDLRGAVARLLESERRMQVPHEKRESRRFVFRKGVVVTPIEDQSGRLSANLAFSGFGCDVSTTGFGFVARQLLPSRRAVVSFHVADAERLHILFDARWVRFTHGGWYQIGGRFIELVPRCSELDTSCESERKASDEGLDCSTEQLWH